MQPRRPEGFSLIEIMVVVAIIGTLLGLVAWKLLGSKHSADVTATRARMQNIRTALELYRLDAKKFPTAEAGLKALTVPPANRSEGYLDEPDLLDAWGNPIQYAVPGPGGKPYDLVSFGYDGTAGGEKENADFSCWDAPAAPAP